MDIMLFNKGDDGIQGRSPRKLVSHKPRHSKIYAVRSEPLEIPLGRSVISDQWQIPPYKFCHCAPEWVEFRKVVDLDDMGIVIYRYMTADEEDHDGPTDIFIVQDAKGSMELKRTILLPDTFAKCITDCPVCRKILDRAETLLLTVPWVNRRGLVAVCNGVHQGECVFCPTCSTVADKFFSFIRSAHRKTTDRRIQVEDAMKSALVVQARVKETGKEKAVEKEKEEAKEKGVEEVFGTIKRTETETLQDTTEGSKVKDRTDKIQNKDVQKELETREHLAPDSNETTEGTEVKKGRKIIQKKDVQIELETREYLAPDSKETTEGTEVKKGRKITQKNFVREEKNKMSKEVGKEKKVKQESESTKRRAPDLKDTTEGISEQKKGRVTIQEKAVRKGITVGPGKQRQDRTDEVEENLKGAQQVSSLKIGKKDITHAKADDKQQKVKGKKQVNQLSNISADQKDKSDTKLTSQQEIKSASPKTLRKSKSTVERQKEEEKARKEKEKIEKEEAKAQHAMDVTQMNLMRKLINEQLKDAEKHKKMQKDQDKEKSAVEKQAAAAEQKVEQAERLAIAREKEAVTKPTVPIPPASQSSLEHPPSSIEECGDGVVEEITHMVKSEKIVAYKDVKALLSELPVDHTPKPCPPVPQSTVASAPETAITTSRSDATPITNQWSGDKIMTYSLSDRTFIEKGWTQLPKETLMRQFTIFHMDRARPEFDWFELNRHKVRMYYDSGELLARFDEGRCCLFYRSGKIALDYYEAEDTQARLRLVVYSTGEPDAQGRLRSHAVLAAFDYAGNGVVFDHAGNVRLKYNQTEGIVLDKDIGPESHWKWHCLNEPPLFTTVIMDTTLAWKDPTIQKLGEKLSSQNIAMNDEVKSGMLEIEMGNIARKMAEQRQRKFTPFKIRMKALKINVQFSLKVLDQATIYLNFCDGATNLKINVGMVLDPTVIVGQELAEVGEISSFMDNALARIVLRY